MPEHRWGGLGDAEVRAAATVRPSDVAGLRRAAGTGLVVGAVLSDDARVVPFGERMFAAPLSALRA